MDLNSAFLGGGQGELWFRWARQSHERLLCSVFRDEVRMGLCEDCFRIGLAIVLEGRCKFMVLPLWHNNAAGLVRFYTNGQ